MQGSLNISEYNTPIGLMYACADSQGVCLLEFSKNSIIEDNFLALEKRMNKKIQTGRNNHLDQLRNELIEYFEGQRKSFNVLLNPSGTVFQLSVWDVLKQIPYGEKRTYKQQAQKINNLPAIRAVASANGKNPISIIIPCHRVIGSDGSLTGYGGGLERKQWLLEFESLIAGHATQEKIDFL